MDWTNPYTLLFSVDVPRLPDLDVLRWARRLSWGIVLAGLGLVLLRRESRPLRMGWVGLMLVWVSMPGPWSPSFWLGLAFQSPSLMTTGLFLWLVCLKVGCLDQPNFVQVQALWRMSWLGVLLGWVLLLDTFALWHFSFYAFGFSPAAVLAVALLAVVPWVAGGPQAWGAPLALLAGVLLLQVVLRLPTGNVWDALLDPWLWLALHAGWLIRGFRRLNVMWRKPLRTSQG